MVTSGSTPAENVTYTSLRAIIHNPQGLNSTTTESSFSVGELKTPATPTTQALWGPHVEISGFPESPNACSARSIALARAAALLIVSWYSASGCESATIPPAACRWYTHWPLVWRAVGTT